MSYVADKELLKLARDLVTCGGGHELIPSLTDKSDTFREELATAEDEFDGKYRHMCQLLMHCICSCGERLPNSTAEKNRKGQPVL